MYGGIERVADFLVRRLVDRGHDVTLIAHPESRTPAALIPYGSPPHFGRSDRLRELRSVGEALWRIRVDLDVVHSFGRLDALLPVLPIRRLAKLQSYQRAEVPWSSVRVAAALAGDSIAFTGCSSSVYKKRQPRFGQWMTVYNGVDIARYTFQPHASRTAPLVFLGRIERIKGTHTAIQIARGAGRRLVIAGNRVDEPEGRAYFDNEIAPQLDDQIEYIGPVDDAQKNDVLGNAAALLMPIEWEEPFGIVMAEALACGTPVIGFPRGSVPEVVIHATNGFVVNSAESAIEAVGSLHNISREAVRRDCEARFSDDVITTQYESLYRRLASH